MRRRIGFKMKPLTACLKNHKGIALALAMTTALSGPAAATGDQTQLYGHWCGIEGNTVNYEFRNELLWTKYPDGRLMVDRLDSYYGEGLTIVIHRADRHGMTKFEFSPNHERLTQLPTVDMTTGEVVDPLRKFVRCEEAEGRPVPPQPQPQPTTYKVKMDVSLGYLNLRTGPAPNAYEVVTKVPAGVGGIVISGQCVKLPTSSSPFCPVEWNGYKGWMARAWIEPDISHQTSSK